MKKQVLSVVLGLAVTAAAGSAFAAGADNRMETLNHGELLGQIVQDRVLSISEGKDNVLEVLLRIKYYMKEKEHKQKMKVNQTAMQY